MRIIKFHLDQAYCYFTVKRGSVPLCVQLQDDKVTVWIDEPTNTNELIRIEFAQLVTGQHYDHEKAKYLGTIQQSNGKFVIHVYWRTTE